MRRSVVWRAPAAGVLVTAFLGAGAASVAGPEAAHAAPGRCAPGTGVTVVVDYGRLGGGVAIGCDTDGAGRPASQVVPEAGFPLSYVVNEPGFVCSVSGKPDPSRSCQRTPPTNAYWGLFWSDGTSTRWNYASTGVGGLKVPAGGSIGWRFQDGGSRDDPGAAPTTRSAPKPSPKPSPPPPRPSAKPSPTAPRPGPAIGPSDASSPAAPGRPPAGSSALSASSAPATSPAKAREEARDERQVRQDARGERTREREVRRDRHREREQAEGSTSAGERYATEEPLAAETAQTTESAPTSGSSGGTSGTTAVALALLGSLAVTVLVVARRRANR